MRVVGIVAMRMGSHRLPGKSLMDIAGQPLLAHLLNRLKTCSSLDEVVVATTSLAEDKPITDYARSSGVGSFRGSSHDVLERITQAAKEYKADTCVVVYGDGPLIDPEIIDFAVDSFQTNSELDFLGNDLKSTFPSGMEVEVVRFEALLRSHELCSDSAIREHGTLFLRQHPKLFNVENFEAQGSWRRPDLFFEVDEEDDLPVVEAIAAFLKEKNSYALDEIVRFADENNLSRLNSAVNRRYQQFRESK